MAFTTSSTEYCTFGRSRKISKNTIIDENKTANVVENISNISIDEEIRDLLKRNEDNRNGENR